MNQPLQSRRPGPPHNPGVSDLVAGKRCGSPPSKPEAALAGFRGWHERGFLPHRDEPGLTQFVTFHLADSYPTAMRSEWATLQAIIMKTVVNSGDRKLGAGGKIMLATVVILPAVLAGCASYNSRVPAGTGSISPQL
jgi:hypothetical protein